jgi:hypothetical protein
MRVIGTNYPRLPYYSNWIDEVTADNPYGWFKLNESSGNASNAGSAGGTYVLGSTTGLTRLASGLLTYSGNYAYSFNNTASAYVTLGGTFNGDTLDLNNAVTFEGLVKFSSTTAGRAFICGQNADATGYLFDAYTDAGYVALAGFVNNYFDTSVSVTTSVAVDTNAWYHVVYTFQANASTLYLNGEQVAVTPLSNYTMVPTTGTSTINLLSRFNGTYSQSRNSSIDEIAIYRTALSPTRIRAHAVVAGLYS